MDMDPSIYLSIDQLIDWLLYKSIVWTERLVMTVVIEFVVTIVGCCVALKLVRERWLLYEMGDFWWEFSIACVEVAAGCVKLGIGLFWGIGEDCRGSFFALNLFALVLLFSVKLNARKQFKYRTPYVQQTLLWLRY